MAILSLGLIPELKKELESFGYTIHVHDACGGQSFTLELIADETNSRVYDFLEEYFSKHRMKLSYFGKDKLNFIAK